MRESRYLRQRRGHKGVIHRSCRCEGRFRLVGRIVHEPCRCRRCLRRSGDIGCHSGNRDRSGNVRFSRDIHCPACGSCRDRRGDSGSRGGRSGRGGRVFAYGWRHGSFQSRCGSGNIVLRAFLSGRGAGSRSCLSCFRGSASGKFRCGLRRGRGSYRRGGSHGRCCSRNSRVVQRDISVPARKERQRDHRRGGSRHRRRNGYLKTQGSSFYLRER